MKEKWIDHSRKEIYFLEWVAQASGFDENQILENMKPENQKWISSINNYYTIEDFIEKEIACWVSRLFYWDRSILNSLYEFWNKIDVKWKRNFIFYKKNNYKFIFSKYPILNWKIQMKSSLKFQKIKIKENKLKI
jgi:hypothetical protein